MIYKRCLRHCGIVSGQTSMRIPVTICRPTGPNNSGVGKFRQLCKLVKQNGRSGVKYRNKLK